MSEFKPGDTVQLKSGGALMTVEQVGEDDYGEAAVWCVWQEKSGTKRIAMREVYKPVVLVSANRGIGAISVSRA